MNLALHEYYKDNGVYDPKLALFIKRHELFINKKTFLQNIYVECLLQNRDLDYEKSIYSLLETFDTEEYKFPYFYFNAIYESSFMLFQDKFHELVHSPVDLYATGIKCDSIAIKDGKFTSVDLVKYVDDESLLIDNLPTKEQILIIFLRSYKNKNKQINISDSYEDIVNLSKNIKVNKDFDTYILIPCIIYILKKIQKDIMHETNYII